MMEAQYDDVHRWMLQTLMLKRSMPEDDLIQLLNERMDVKFAKLNRNGSSAREPFQLGARDLNEAMTTINNLLDRYRMQLQVIPRKFFEVDNIKYWTLISTNDDEIVRATGAKALTEWQLVLLKETLDAIIDSSDGFVRMTQVDSMAKQASRSRKILEVEAFLNKMVDDQWLARSQQRAGMFTAGIRSLTELHEYMKAMGAHMCTVNKIPVIRTRVYKQKFGGDDDDEEEEEDEDQQPTNKRKKQTRGGGGAESSSRSSRRRTRAPVDDDDDDDDDDEEEEEEEAEQQQQQQDDEEEEEEEEDAPAKRRNSRRRR